MLTHAKVNFGGNNASYVAVAMNQVFEGTTSDDIYYSYKNPYDCRIPSHLIDYEDKMK